MKASEKNRKKENEGGGRMNIGQMKRCHAETQACHRISDKDSCSAPIKCAAGVRDISTKSRDTTPCSVGPFIRP